MRFPAVQPRQPLRQVPAADPSQVQPERPPQPAPVPPRADELPAALDERLRLVGEW